MKPVRKVLTEPFWSDLEFAFTWRTEEGGHYLDLETGEVVTVTATEDDELGQFPRRRRRGSIEGASLERS